MRVRSMVVLTYAKLASGVVFWIMPVYYMLLKLPLVEERRLVYVQMGSGMVLYSLSLYIRIMKSDSRIKEILIYNLVFVPVFLMMYCVELIFLSILSFKLYGIPSDIF